MTGPSSLVFSVAMLAAGALVWGGIARLRRREKLQGWLMLACAAVLVGNVLIWTL